MPLTAKNFYEPLHPIDITAQTSSHLSMPHTAMSRPARIKVKPSLQIATGDLKNRDALQTAAGGLEEHSVFPSMERSAAESVHGFN